MVNNNVARFSLPRASSGLNWEKEYSIDHFGLMEGGEKKGREGEQSEAGDGSAVVIACSYLSILTSSIPLLRLYLLCHT